MGLRSLAAVAGEGGRGGGVDRKAITEGPYNLDLTCCSNLGFRSGLARYNSFILDVYVCENDSDKTNIHYSIIILENVRCI